MTDSQTAKPHMTGNLGTRLRALRIAQRITQKQIADRTGMSKSFISAVELDRARPSIASMRKIAGVLGVPLGAFFEEQDDNSGSRFNEDDGGQAPEVISTNQEVAVVRSDRRKVIMWPGRDFKTYLLTPDLQRKLQVITTEFELGYQDEEESDYAHVGEEFVLVLQGIYEVTVAGQAYVLHEGDTIYYPSHLPHRSRVLSDVPVRTLTVITPPSF